MLISFPANGRSASGYLSLPKSGSGAGLIVIQEWWGLVDHIRKVTDRFAAAGFVALAPDLYGGQQAKSPDQAGKMLMALNIADAGKDLRGAADYLLGHDAVQPKRVGAIGFCMGGQLALFAAQEHPDRVTAAVDFYGIHPNVNIEPARVKIPVQGHFGKKDPSVKEESARALFEGIGSQGGKAEAFFYDAGHAFFNDARPEAYDLPSAEKAWERTLKFLRTHLA